MAVREKMATAAAKGTTKVMGMMIRAANEGTDQPPTSIGLSGEVLSSPAFSSQSAEGKKVDIFQHSGHGHW